MRLEQNDSLGNPSGVFIEIDHDIQWTDEFDWSGVDQSEPERTRNGGLVGHRQEKFGGRPITLSGDWNWIPRGSFTTFQEWTGIADLDMTLTLDNTDVTRTFKVVFRLNETAIEATPVHFVSPETGISHYTGTIRLMEIA